MVLSYYLHKLLFWNSSFLTSLTDIPILINISQSTVSSASVPTIEVLQISDPLTKNSLYLIIFGIVINVVLMLIILITILACVVKIRTQILQKPTNDQAFTNARYRQDDSHGNKMIWSLNEGAFPSAKDLNSL